MIESSFLGMAHNAALLLAVALIFDITRQNTHHLTRQQLVLSQILYGFAIGTIGIVVMLTPWVWGQGVIFDTRSILLGISGLFFGSLPTLIAMACTATLRFMQGGSGMWMGVSVILATGSLGIAWRHMRRRQLEAISWRELYLFGLVLHLTMLALTIALPREIASIVLLNIGLPVLIIYPIGTALLGRLMINRLQRERIAHELQQSEDQLRKTAASLRKSEEQYRLLTENIKDVVWILDVDTLTFQYCSPSVEKLRGYTPEEILTAPLTHAFTEQASPQLLELLRSRAEAFKTGQVPPNTFYTDEIEQPCKDGSTIWTEVITSYYRPQDSDRVEIRGVTRDIRERKQAEDTLRKSEEKFSTIFHDNPIAMTLSTLNEGRFIDVNPAFLRMTGFAYEEVIGHTTFDLHLWGSPEQRRYAISTILEQGSVHNLEMQGITKSGKEITISWTGNTTMISQTRYLLTSAVDITKRKQAEEDLKLFKSIVEASQEAISVANRNGQFIYVNPAHTSLFGLTLDQARGVNFRQFYPSSSIEVLDNIVVPTLQQGQPWEGELDALDLHGRRFPLWHSAGSVRDGPSDLKYTFAVMHDVTERKVTEERAQAAQVELRRLLADAEQSRRTLLSVIEDQKAAEEQVRALNAELELRVSIRTAQLKAANQELEAFSYSVSHDLRAPLRAMDGFTSLLFEDYGSQLDEQAHHYLQRIQESSQRMGQLINDLLNLSRITRTEFKRQQVDLSTLAQEIFAELKTQNPHRQVAFEVATPLVVQGDSSLLKILLENLLSNAVKFTSQCDKAFIQLGMLKQGEETIYFVRDNGAGFNMEYAKKLFAPFQRLHRAQDYPGSGIGLSIVQRIVIRHGGRIWPEAAVGQGATFYFTLGGQG